MRDGSGRVIGTPSCDSVPLEAGDQPQQRRFATAAWPEERHELARLQLQVDAVEHRQRAGRQGKLMADSPDVDAGTARLRGRRRDCLFF